MSFSESVRKWATKAGLEIDKAVTAVCVQLSEAIIQDTPVDTGRLRNNWVPSIGTANQSTTEKADKTGQGAISRARQVAEGASGKVYYLTNSLPYVRRIEYEGWSKVKAPKGMVRINVARVKRAIKKAGK